MHGKRDDDEDSLSFDACRSRRLANLSGVQHQRKEVIPLWEDHLMHEEPCHDGSEDFAPFDKDIPVCVLTENSSYYIQDFKKNYFDRQYASLVGGPAQKTPNFQMAPTPKKTYQNC
jgi:hypothetical protein